MNDEKFDKQFNQLKKFVKENGFRVEMTDDPAYMFRFGYPTSINMNLSVIWINTYEITFGLPNYHPAFRKKPLHIGILTLLCHEIGHLIQFVNNTLKPPSLMSINERHEVEKDANIKAESVANEFQIDIDKEMLWASANKREKELICIQNNKC